MTTKEKILRHIKNSGPVSGSAIAELLDISRQAVNKHLKDLIEAGKVEKTGVTRGAAYRIPSPKVRETRITDYSGEFTLDGLGEDEVFKSFDALLGLEKALSPNAHDIVQYAFTEMLNNAVDHSESEKCTAGFDIDGYNVRFRVRDRGVGIFHNISRKLDLPGEDAAVGELIKGKTTTMPERHTGEGIFFTSKAADFMSFRSHERKLIFQNKKEDVFLEASRFFKGTEVVFEISKRSKRKLEEIFNRYAPEEYDYRFEKTRVFVKLFKKEYISRSEAKRMVHGLDKFSEVILDFKGVKSIGQGFTDEVFRVFRKARPGIKIAVENLSPALKPMLKHVVDEEEWAELTID